LPELLVIRHVMPGLGAPPDAGSGTGGGDTGGDGSGGGTSMSR
jgi:hypothetical protein